MTSGSLQSSSTSPQVDAGLVRRFLVAVGRIAKGCLIAVVEMVWWGVTAPFRSFRFVRSAMTASSTILLVFAIVSMNIVWGYPWLGCFAAISSMMFAGFIINRVFCPKLTLGFGLPVSARAGQSFPVNVFVNNQSRIPAFELFLRFDERQSKTAIETKRHYIETIRRRDQESVQSSMVFDERGIHDIPGVVVDSFFPFHLFKATRQIDSCTTIPVTPRLLNQTAGALAQNLAISVAGFAKRQVLGDSMEYSGSREYQTGMPVRRWDYSSWARLGKPIVREFTSPSVQSVVVVVDTGWDDAQEPDTAAVDASAAAFELAMSTAATAINDLLKNSIRVRLAVTSEDPENVDPADHMRRQSFDPALMMIRLAEAQRVEPSLADRRIGQAYADADSTAVLVIGCRDVESLADTQTKQMTVIKVGLSDESSEGEVGSQERRSFGSNVFARRGRKDS